jgi:hypothetical protein
MCVTYSLATSKLLCNETGSGKHGKAAVLKLLGLHGFQFSRAAELRPRGSKPMFLGVYSARRRSAWPIGTLSGSTKPVLARSTSSLPITAARTVQKGTGTWAR